MLRGNRLSVVEAVAKFHVDLTGVVPVETAEGLTVVEIHSPIGQIQRVQRCGELVAEILAEGKIDSCVLRQVVPGIRLSRKGITEAGAIVNISRGIGSPCKNDVATDVERVALIVIEGKEESWR